MYFVQPPPEKITKQTKPPKPTPDTQQVHTSHHEANKILQHPPLEREHINERIEPRQQDKPSEPTITTEQQSQLQSAKVQKQDQNVHATQSPQGGPSLHRSKCVKLTPQRLIELMYTEMVQQEIPGELLSLSTLFPHDATMDMPNNPLLAFKATNSDPDTMYHHQAMHQPDRAQFIGAMQKEMDLQLQDGNFEIVHRSKIPSGT